MISTFTAVFDSNVLFSNRLTSLLMWLAMSGLFRARWSNDIHREWMEAVSRERGIPIAKLEGRRQYMDAAVPDSCVTGYEDLIPALSLPDPDDRHVLAAAIRCGAGTIVNFNTSDFPADALLKYSLHTRTPDDFILDVDGLSQGTLLNAARDDIAHYIDPAISVDDYIEGIRNAQAQKQPTT